MISSVCTDLRFNSIDRSCVYTVSGTVESQERWTGTGDWYLFHDSTVMKEIPIETGAYYIFDRGYNNFKELYRIHRAESFFVVRAKTHHTGTGTA